MKTTKSLSAIAVFISFTAAPLAGFAADQAAKPQPDKLTTCPVSDEKLGQMGKPYVFEYKGQEVKLCCKNCRKDFDKDPAKYLKKIRAADKEAPADKKAKN
jgi:YHS domain-containing protein